MDKFLGNNNVLRVIALVLACILWLMVSTPGINGLSATGGITEKFPKAVHVEVSQNMVLTGVDQPAAVVVVNSNPTVVTTLPTEMLNSTVVADARGLSPGRHIIPLAVMSPPNSTYSIQPTSVTVTLAPRVTRSIPVVVQLEGSPANGMAMGTPSASPKQVEVSGSADAVKKVASVQAQVTVAGADQALTKITQLTPLDAKGNIVTGVSVQPPVSTITVPLRTPHAEVDAVPEVIGSPAAGYAVSGVTVNPVKVQVYQTGSTETAISAVDVPVAVTGLRKTTTLEVSVPLPNGVAQVTPSLVKVTVQVEDSITKSLNGVPVQIENMPQGLNVSLIGHPTVNLTVTGPKSVVQGLTPQSVTAYVDASTVKAGDTTADLNITVPAWVQVGKLSLHKVHITAK